MTNKKTIVAVLLCFWLGHSLSAQSDNNKNGENDNISISAKLSGAAFVTKNLEASVKFYTSFLGFKVHKRITIDSPAGIAPFGLSGDKKLRYVALLPAEWSVEKPYFPGLNFIEIIEAEANPFSQGAKRKSMEGEVMKAYSVVGLVEIADQMKKEKVPIVTPLAPSATGKSMTLTVIDPNGIRVQLYEIIK